MKITLIVLVIYLAFIFLIAGYFSRKESLEAYFLNKRKTGLWLLTFANAATIIGAGGTVAIVAETYNSGISMGIALPFSFIVGMLVLGFVAKKIKSVGDKYKASTVVDFFQNRYDKKNKVLVGILQVLLMIIWMGIQAIALASLATVLIGLEYHIAIILTAIITIGYTSIGGLKVDIITDFIQFWIILIMFLVMSAIGYFKVGGFTELLTQLPAGHLDPFAFGGVTWFLGFIFLSAFIYLGNGIHWQRIFSAEDTETAKNSFYLAMPFMLLVALLTVFLGLTSVILLSGITKETAIFSLMDNMLPAGLLGLGFASVLAVIMSSIDSLLIGGSTIIYNAIFKDHKFSRKKELLFARLITAAFGALGFILAFLVQDIILVGMLAVYQALIFVPAVIAGLYSKKTSSNASFYSILIPTIILLTTYPILTNNAFVISTPISILIILIYDRIPFLRRSKK